jgi:hypothetical protein
MRTHVCSWLDRRFIWTAFAGGGALFPMFPCRRAQRFYRSRLTAGDFSPSIPPVRHISARTRR